MNNGNYSLLTFHSLTFISDIKAKNEKIMEYLSSDDLQLIIGQVTDVMMTSQTIMYELLRAKDF